MLTKRELECLHWALLDKSVKETARAMYVSTHTVKLHRHRILQKYNCKTMLAAYIKHNVTVKKGDKDE